MCESLARVQSRWTGARIAFSGSPVWLVHLPLMLKALVWSLLLLATALYAALHGWPLVWPACGAMLGWPLGVLVYRLCETQTTHILINDARLTWQGGLLTRRVVSVELYRVQNVEARSEWWQRFFGFGTLVIESSDVNHPLWVLPGMPEIERLRDALTEHVVAVRNTMGVREFNVGRV